MWKPLHRADWTVEERTILDNVLGDEYLDVEVFESSSSHYYVFADQLDNMFSEATISMTDSLEEVVEFLKVRSEGDDDQ